ncbi:ATP-binding protein [candidate division KSB1 bacterium]
MDQTYTIMQFRSITGQDEIKKKLIQTVKENRVSHTQLFSGPSGSGKLALALAYTQFINCDNKEKLEDDSCGECASCIKFNKLIHPDVHFIYPVAATPNNNKPKSADFLEDWRTYLESSGYYPELEAWYSKTGIENKQAIISARDCEYIISKLGLKAYEGNNKFVILWMVERLFHSAAPKLLKILEEPPEKTYFILITENPDQIISTIVSRCQQVKIPKIDHASLFKSLQKEYEIPQSELRKIVNQSNGNYNLALSLLRNQEEINYYFEKFIYWMRMCYALNIAELVNIISEMSKIGRERQKVLLNYGLSVIRKALHVNNGRIELENFEMEERKFLEKFSQFVVLENIEQINDAFNKAIYHIERNGNPSIIFMDFSLLIHQLLHKEVSV